MIVCMCCRRSARTFRLMALYGFSCGMLPTSAATAFSIVFSDGGVRPPGAGLDDFIHVVSMQPDLQGRQSRVVLQDPLQLIAEGAKRLVGGEDGAREADACNGGARGDRHLGVGAGGENSAAQPIRDSIAHGSPGSLGPIDQGGQQERVG